MFYAAGQAGLKNPCISYKEAAGVQRGILGSEPDRNWFAYFIFVPLTARAARCVGREFTQKGWGVAIPKMAGFCNQRLIARWLPKR
jgi:hypothetical protein